MISEDHGDIVYLYTLLSKIKMQYPPAEGYSLRVSFYPYKHLSHTIRLRNGVIQLRLSDKLRQAPDEVLEAITVILFDKLFHYQTPKHVRTVYKAYEASLDGALVEVRHRDVTKRYTPHGNYYNLSDLFERLNRLYFGGALKKPHLGWSHKRSYRRLGFYSERRKLLVVSRIFDHKKCPGYVVEFIMYHEMLHLALPVVKKNGRNVIHPAEFKAREKNFYDYFRAEKFLQKKLRKLL